MKRSARYSALLMAAAAVFASLPGCVTHRHAARPLEAVVSIEVGGQWKVIKKVEYRYMENLETLPKEELEVMERDAVARGDWAKASAIRILLEQRKAGIK